MVTMKFCNKLPKFQDYLGSFDKLESNDVDYNLPRCISKKYYEQKLNTSKNFNVYSIQMLMVLKTKWIAFMNFYQVLLKEIM